MSNYYNDKLYREAASPSWLHWLGSLKAADADTIIAGLEQRKLGWSLDHTGSMIEARIWEWPYVIGRHRNFTGAPEPLADMLRKALERVEATKDVSSSHGD